MKHQLVLGAAAAVLLGGQAAIAADLVVADPIYSPIVEMADTYDWSGPYVGAHLGGVVVAGEYDAGVGSVDSISLSGAVGGLLAGYNLQLTDGIVAGVELDGGWASASNDDVIPGPGPVTTTLNWDAHVRARLGASFDRALLYVAGGVGFANVTQDLPAGPASVTETVFGFTLGGGVEYAFTDNLSVRGEYLYSDYASQTYDYTPFGGGTIESDYASHTLRAGLSYNF